MKISNLWMVALMAISFSFGLSACSNVEDDSNDSTPITEIIAGNYQYQTSLALTIQNSPYGNTSDCKAVIQKASDTTVDITINGFGNTSTTTKSSGMNLGDFTVENVSVTTTDNGGYTLSIGTFEATAGTTAITGESLNGTISANGTATLKVIFKPGSMPIAITADFTGSKTNSEK